MSAARQVAFRLKSDGKAEVQRDFADVGRSGVAAYGQIEQASEEANRAADRQMAKWRQMAQAAKEAGRAADEQRRINLALGVDRPGVKSAKDSFEAFQQAPGRGLSTMQRQTMIYTASDVFASAASGMNPAMIAMQQGPQVLQAFAVEGGKASASMIKLAGAIGLPVAAVALLTAAFLSQREANRQLEVSVSGVGAASGMTADGLSALAEANRSAGQVTAGAAREMAAAYVETGRIGGEVVGQLIASTRTYATVTRQDAKAATAELAKAFADPAKGAEVLNAKLGLLDDGTYRYIQTLMEQNRVTDAQLVLSDALSRRLETAASNVSVLGGAWDTVKLKAAGAWEWMGKAVDRALGGGPKLDRIQMLQAQRSDLVDVGGKVAEGRIAQIDAELSKLRGELAAEKKRGEQTAANQVAADARAAQDRINPLPARLRELKADEAKIKAGIDKGGLIDTKQAEKDLAALRKEIKAVEAGYSSASAQASALSKDSRTAAADARKAAREAEREAKEAEKNAKRLADLQLRNQLTVARAADNKTLVEQLEIETRLRALIADYQAAGVGLLEAQLRAQVQIGQETKAEYETRRKALLETPVGFVSTADAMGKHNSALDNANDNIAAANQMKGAYESAFDMIADRVAAGETDWNRWRDTGRAATQELIGELMKLAAINPLKNLLFGQDNPTLGSGGIFSAIFGGGKSGGASNILPGDQPTFGFPKAIFSGAKSVVGSILGAFGIPGFATGTDYAPGGWAEVGEHGRELVRLPRGSKVYNAQRTAAMSRGGDVNVPISVTFHAEGAGPREVEALERRMAEFERGFPGRVVAAVNDARERRWVS